MEKSFWEKWSAILLTVCLGALIFYCVFRYAFLILLPFLLAWLLSLPLRPLSQKMAKKCRLPHPLCAILLLTLTVGLGAWGLIAAVGRLLSEVGGLVDRLLSDGTFSKSLDALLSWIGGIAVRFGGESGEEWREKLYAMASDMVGGFLSTVAAGLPDAVARVFASLPTVLFAVVLTVLSGYYLCVDWERVSEALSALIPTRWRGRAGAVRARARELLGRYVRAYLLLLAITFSLLFVGLLILRIDYAFLLAVLVALLDLLPVLGVGTVLLPWSIVMLILRRYYVGFGLILLYLVIVLVRQVLEPRLVGKSLGLHPLVMLFATYAGFSLFGLVGMILGPIAAIPIKYAFDALDVKRKGGSP